MGTAFGLLKIHQGCIGHMKMAKAEIERREGLFIKKEAGPVCVVERHGLKYERI